ncbi:MAG: phytoene/squalene synthase family protein [Pseudomonadota bacterium]
MIENGSRSFFAASRLLPRRITDPCFALYAFCRLADDTVDVVGGRANAIRQLRRRLDRIYAGAPMPLAPDRAFADVVGQYQIPKILPEALIEGLEWDVEERQYETMDDLFDYCVRVAGTVGVMMACIMGTRNRDALARACDLGVAMQLTNIARDIGEDARAGRLYIPRQWLSDAGLDASEWLRRPTANPALRDVVRRLLNFADILYCRAEAGISSLPRECRPAIMAARLIYADIGREIRCRNYDSVNDRAIVSTTRKLRLLGRAVGRTIWIDGAVSAPCLPQALYLVDAAVTVPRADPKRDWREQLVWTIDLFARLEARDQMLRLESQKDSVLSSA